MSPAWSQTAVRAHQVSLADAVRLDGAFQHAPWPACRQGKMVVQGIKPEKITVGAAGRARRTVAIRAVLFLPVIMPDSRSETLSGRSPRAGSMLYATQWVRAPFGASGSSRVRASDRVSSGRSVQGQRRGDFLAVTGLFLRDRLVRRKDRALQTERHNASL
jgi:hypothetical protein